MACSTPVGPWTSSADARGKRVRRADKSRRGLRTVMEGNEGGERRKEG